MLVDGLSVGDVGEVVLRDRRALASDGMFIVVVTVDKQTGRVVAKPEIVTRGFVHGNERDPLMDGAVERIMAAVERPGRPDQRGRLAQEPDQGRDLPLPVRADAAAAARLPGRGGGLDAGPDTAAGRSSATGRAGPRRPVEDDVRVAAGRSRPDRCDWSSAWCMLIVGVDAPDRPARCRAGSLTDWERNPICAVVRDAPRWLLPFILIVLGYYLERAQGDALGLGADAPRQRSSPICAVLGLFELLISATASGGTASSAAPLRTPCRRS